jgi:hypothetical protein
VLRGVQSWRISSGGYLAASLPLAGLSPPASSRQASKLVKRALFTSLLAFDKKNYEKVRKTMQIRQQS